MAPKMTDSGLIVPTVHMNGTSRNALQEQLTEASLAIDNALTKLMLAIPHGRDYYVQGDSALKLAMDQHRARVQKLIDVREEIKDIVATLLI
jgi:hypothetical protein